MASALALGRNGPRLRSRRFRSDRSHRLSLGFALAVIAFASLVWYEAGTFGIGRFEPAASVDVAAASQQQFLVELQPIHIEVQQSVEQEGLLVAAFQGGQIDRVELQRQLADVLSSYQREAAQLDSLSPPPPQATLWQSYVDAVRNLSDAAAALSTAYDDGDQGRVAMALGQSLQAMARLHSATELIRPTRD